MFLDIMDILGRTFALAWSVFSSVVFSIEGLWAYVLSMITIFAIWRFIMAPIFGATTGGSDRNAAASQNKKAKDA